MDDSSDIFGQDEAESPDDGFMRDPDMPDDALGLGLDMPPVAAKPAPAPAAAQPYRVLARKYRPQSFSALIGQDAMVQTLANAIKRDRLAHAFLMTGVRGVGKTSTARLIAKALNCVGPDGQGGPTIDPCGVCEPCTAIAEGRHIDVIEMDAASHTGVDDVREIIEAVRYSAVSARYKIYIIDEVHMLSRNAFNALLKTLEEPPAHVKFLFATTEVEKLPVTVLSRCQRFDLRRIPVGLLASHFAGICTAENVAGEDEALAMIAEAAEGSVRDGLSILDQAIAHADMASGGQGGPTLVTAAQVQEMLGLADKTVQRRLLAALLAGDGGQLLEIIAAQFALGVEPVALLRGTMDLVHRITVCQLGKSPAESASAEERTAITDWAQSLATGQLHRLWQLLLKGHDEVRTAPDPLVAAEMALLRCLHAADLPDPGQLIKRLEDLAAHAPAAPANNTPAAPSQPSPTGQMREWEAMVHRIDSEGALDLANKMRMQMRLVDLAPGTLRFSQAPGFSDDLITPLRGILQKITGQIWQIDRCDEEGLPTLVEQAEGAAAAQAAALQRHPLYQAALKAFPDAREVIEDDTPAPGRTRNWSQRA